jgi:hypothetical protein
MTSVSVSLVVPNVQPQATGHGLGVPPSVGFLVFRYNEAVRGTEGFGLL